MREDGAIVYDNFLDDLENKTVPDNVSVDGAGLQDESEVSFIQLPRGAMIDVNLLDQLLSGGESVCPGSEARGDIQLL